MLKKYGFLSVLVLALSVTTTHAARSKPHVQVFDECTIDDDCDCFDRWGNRVPCPQPGPDIIVGVGLKPKR